MKNITRRTILKTLGTSAGVSIFGIQSFSSNKETIDEERRKLKLIVVGAHPDDPETNCGGTISLFTKNGYEVIIAYLTRGEAGITGKTYNEAANIRTGEAKAACEILKARPVFLGQLDGDCEITKDNYSSTYNLFKKEKPDIVITHWPIDTHRDHRICSNLVYDAWLKLGRSFELYYSESMSGLQSQGFQPDTYVDITPVIKQKHTACYCHQSQNMDEVYSSSHELMEVFRGMESNCKYAEAFVSQLQSKPLF